MVNIFEFVPKLPKFWQVVDPKKKKRKFNFQNNGENFKCIAYPEQKLLKF